MEKKLKILINQSFKGIQYTREKKLKGLKEALKITLISESLSKYTHSTRYNGNSDLLNS